MNMAKILLVDDEANFLSVMEKRLAARDLAVLTAESGQKALEVLEADPDVDVVILDVKMPGMDGLDTLCEIRGAYPLVEVVMLTGHGTIENAITGMKKGAFDYLLKPCDIAKLIDLVRRAKEKKSLHEEKIIQAQMKDITGRMGV